MVLVCVVLATVALHAQKIPPDDGLLNDWLRQQNGAFNDFDLGAQFRSRFVYQTYFAVPGAGTTAVDFRTNTPDSVNDFILN